MIPRGFGADQLAKAASRVPKALKTPFILIMLPPSWSSSEGIVGDERFWISGRGVTDVTGTHSGRGPARPKPRRSPASNQPSRISKSEWPRG